MREAIFPSGGSGGAAGDASRAAPSLHYRHICQASDRVTDVCQVATGAALQVVTVSPPDNWDNWR